MDKAAQPGLGNAEANQHHILVPNGVDRHTQHGVPNPDDLWEANDEAKDDAQDHSGIWQDEHMLVSNSPENIVEDGQTLADWNDEQTYETYASSEISHEPGTDANKQSADGPANEAKVPKIKFKFRAAKQAVTNRLKTVSL